MRKKFQLAAALCLAVGLAPFVTPVLADDARHVVRQFGEGFDQVSVMADNARYDLDSSWAVFSGNVIVRSGEQELRADRIRFNSSTYAAQAYGRVTLVGLDGSVWSGDALNVNLKEKAGSAADISAYYKPFRIEAGRGSVEMDTYIAEDVILTTCTNAPGHFHYHISAKRLRLRPDRDLTAHGAVPSVFGVPFFYWPYVWKDLNRHYGFRFEPGYRSRWGIYLLSSYKARIYRDEADRWIDSRTSLDLRSKRGYALGERVNWYMQDYGTGWLSLYWLDDSKRPLPLGVEDPERYRIRLNHAWNISERDRILLQGLYVSDDQFMRDFFESEHVQMNQPDNYLSYTHTRRDFAAGAIARLRLNDFYEQTERLPEVWANLNQLEILETGIYYESRNALSFLRKQFDERRDPLPESYDALRADTLHRLSLPLKVGFVNLVPRAAYRGTYYSESVRRWDEEETYTVAQTNELGKVTSTTGTRTVGRSEDAGATFRNIFEIGAEVSFKAYGMWDGSDGTIWRHVIEPYANYTYVPEPDVLPEELYQFDAVDALDFEHYVRLGLRNRWQYKKGDRAHEVAMVDIYGDLLIEPEDDEDALDRICLDSEFRPVSWMRLDVDAEYSVTNSELDLAATRLLLWHERFTTALEYRYRADRSSLLSGNITWPISPEWSVNLYGRYEFKNSQVEEVGGYLQRSYDCIAFRLYGSMIPGYNRADGSAEKDDYRVSFTAWLTHFPPDRIRESDWR